MFVCVRVCVSTSFLPQRQYAEPVTSGHDERGEKTYVRELEQAVLGGYPLAVGLVERRIRSARGGAVQREDHGRLGGVLVRVIIIVIAGRPVRRGCVVVVA